MRERGQGRGRWWFRPSGLCDAELPLTSPRHLNTVGRRDCGF